MRVRANQKSEIYRPSIGQIESGTPFRFKQGSNIAMKISEGSAAIEGQSPYIYLQSGEHYRSQDKTLVYPCDGEFVEAGAEADNIQIKNCSVHNIHNESGDVFRKTTDKPTTVKVEDGIRYESGITPGGGKYGIASVDDAPDFKKRLDELTKAKVEAVTELEKAGIVIDEISILEAAHETLAGDDPASECLKKIRAELKAVKEKNLSPEEEKAESFRIISQFDDSIDSDSIVPDKPTGNPHWCQFCGRIHHPEPGIIPGNPDKAGKPIKCPAGVAWDDTPYTGIHSSSCDFWVPSNLHAGDYRCPKCHAVLIATEPNLLDEKILCPTCDTRSGYIDMIDIHCPRNNPFVPPEPYIDEETSSDLKVIRRKKSYNLEELLSTLIACPECKSIKVLELRSTPDGMYYVSCQMCTFGSPIALTEKEAVDIWNAIDRTEE